GYDVMQHSADLMQIINQSTDQKIQKDKTMVGLAETYVDQLDEVTKRIPNMNMGQMRKEWIDISSSVKMYNTSMLTTMQMLSVLSDKNVAEKVFGLGAAPLQVRQQMARATALMTETEGVPEGVRVELGRKLWERAKGEGKAVGTPEGKSSQDYMYFFSEGMSAAYGEEAPLVRLQEGMRMAMQHATAGGAKGNALRFNLEKFIPTYLGPQFGGALAVRLAAMATASPERASQIAAGQYGAGLGAEFGDIEKTGKKAKKAALLAEGMDIAVRLQPMETRIQNWIEEHIVKTLRGMHYSLTWLAAHWMGGSDRARRELARLDFEEERVISPTGTLEENFSRVKKDLFARRGLESGQLNPAIDTLAQLSELPPPLRNSYLESLHSSTTTKDIWNMQERIKIAWTALNFYKEQNGKQKFSVLREPGGSANPLTNEPVKMTYTPGAGF
ncbi:MAG: hypothetical protein LUQ65_14680, partial [Candidatus Helarchaeota archaeon]|nr:hypothetical protein [Candidatus Helarchaeota archaeon]